MAVRKIIRMGHPTLRRKAESIAENMIGSVSLSNLIEDMQDTLRDYGGIGLAAPQINESIQLAIIDLPGGQSRYGELEALPLTVCITPSVPALDTATGKPHAETLDVVITTAALCHGSTAKFCAPQD